MFSLKHFLDQISFVLMVEVFFLGSSTGPSQICILHSAPMLNLKQETLYLFQCFCPIQNNQVQECVGMLNQTQVKHNVLILVVSHLGREFSLHCVKVNVVIRVIYHNYLSLTSSIIVKV